MMAVFTEHDSDMGTDPNSCFMISKSDSPIHVIMRFAKKQHLRVIHNGILAHFEEYLSDMSKSEF